MTWYDLKTETGRETDGESCSKIRRTTDVICLPRTTATNFEQQALAVADAG